MQQMINVTQARSRLGQLVSSVAKNKRNVIILRDSLPQAVLISYEQYEKQEKEWDKEFLRLMTESKKNFKTYVKKRTIPYPKNEEAMYELINQATGRN